MDQKEFFRYLAGYIFGGTFFLILIPGMLYLVSVFSGIFFPYIIFADESYNIIAASVLFIPGVVFMVWSNVALFFIGKGGPAEGFGRSISPKTKILVIKGPYRYTRNPMVFGAFSMYLALSVFLNSYVSLMFVFLFLPVIIFYLKKSEEKRLTNDFGEEFMKYRESVSLLIPLPPKK